MTPPDLRDLTWERLQPLLTGQRLAVLAAWRASIAGTTRGVARASGIDILTFRPRTTELYALGLLELIGQDGHQGIYRAIPADQARAAFESHRERAAKPEQTHLKLSA